MKNLHSSAFYALVTPAIALGSSAVLAAQPTDQDIDQEQSGAQPGEEPMKSNTKTVQSNQKMDDQSGMKNQGQMDDMQNKGNMAGMQNKGYMNAPPAKGLHASDLIGTDIKSNGDEKIGSVSDLIIDQDGQVVAVVVGVGGFLGMGEKNVAIPWDDVTKSGTAEEQELRIDATREELQSAPEFVTQK